MDGMNVEQLEEINRRLREMAVENLRLEANRSHEIDELRRDFNNAVQEIKASPEDEQIPSAWLILSDAAHRGQSYFAEQIVLRSLRFSTTDSRQSQKSTPARSRGSSMKIHQPNSWSG